MNAGYCGGRAYLLNDISVRIGLSNCQGTRFRFSLARKSGGQLIELACSYVRSPKQTGKLMCATLLFNFFAFLSFVIDTNANKHTYPSFLDKCLLEMAKM
jgi:hypothetical protein